MKRNLRLIKYVVILAGIVLTAVNPSAMAYLENKFNTLVHGRSDPLIIEQKDGWEHYSELDSLGRVGEASALLHKSMMPTTERESIQDVRPSGWHTVRYDDLIEDKYLFNRCHLIGFQLTGQNANIQNLATCTRACNLNMVPYENEVANYLRNTGNHVEYRVTPQFEGDNLVASGFTIEAHSIEDDTINFTVYIPNEQPGITIDYSNGNSWRNS